MRKSNLPYQVSYGLDQPADVCSLSKPLLDPKLSIKEILMAAANQPHWLICIFTKLGSLNANFHMTQFITEQLNM